ncbi:MULTISPECIES: hypothetical protein [unclassified Mucilaginibacter]
MKALSNIHPQDFEPKGSNQNNYYLLAMLLTVAILLACGYYDQVLATTLR